MVWWFRVVWLWLRVVWWCFGGGLGRLEVVNGGLVVV